jgi:type IV secretory pathway TrbD component
VVFTVDQVSPACLVVGQFTVAGHAGLNRVRFAGVVHGRRLPAGTYRISIRIASGPVVRRVTLVVVDRPTSPGELRARRAANVCSAATTATTRPSFRPAAGLPQPPPTQPEATAGLAPRGPNLHSGVLASSVEKTVRAIRPLLVALLALAILLLAVASLPRAAVPEPRMHDLLARHRVEVVLLGAAALVAAAVTLLLG